MVTATIPAVLVATRPETGWPAAEALAHGSVRAKLVELNPIEIAVGYQRLIEECSLTQEQVAQKVGKNRATVANMLRLLKLPPKIQASLRDATISIGHARALINIEEEAVQVRLVKEIEEKGLSVREVEDHHGGRLHVVDVPASFDAPGGYDEWLAAGKAIGSTL